MKKIVVASRGRNPDNPSDRTSRGGGIMKQRLEPNFHKTNSLTTVCKDNLVMEYEKKDCADNTIRYKIKMG